jgi:hypothetical protein
MTLPSSGTLSLYQINAEFGRGYNLNAYRGTSYFLPGSATQFFFPSTPISFSNFYGTQLGSPVAPGVTSYTSAGSFGYTVPIFNSIVFEFWGAGGSGGPTSGSSGATGGGTYVNFPSVGVGANGGAGGGAGYYRRGAGAGGAGGGAFGGSINTAGSNGVGGFSPYGGAGGGSPNGGAGGSGGYNNGSPGGAPGGGGQGNYFNDGSGSPNYQAGGGAGGGGYSYISFSPAGLSAGTSLTLVVGAGGNNTVGYGADGEIRITVS